MLYIAIDNKNVLIERPKKMVINSLKNPLQETIKK
jgi:hypothetical protein